MSDFSTFTVGDVTANSGFKLAHTLQPIKMILLKLEDSGGHHDANHGQTDGNINHGHDDGKKQHSKPPKHSAHDGKNDGAQKSMRRSVRRPPVKIAQQQQQQHQDHDGGATPPKHN